MRLSRVIIAIVAVATTAAAEEATFSAGRATTTIAGLADCGARSRVSAVGEITNSAGNIRTVPAATHFGIAPVAADLFNECGGERVSALETLDLASVPVMDAGGSEEFATYIFADNYFELHVNGVLIAVDPVPFTPFNSNVVRFKADRPVTLGVMGVDWEENLGLGSEKGRGMAYHPGDAGFVMQVRDVSGAVVLITDGSWKAQTLHTAPLPNRDCLIETGAQRDSSACSTGSVEDGSGYSAAHWDIPEDWATPDFDTSGWPAAATFSNDTVGVDNKRAYTTFAEVFDDPTADPEFIWSSNLVLDNVVLMRATID